MRGSSSKAEIRLRVLDMQRQVSLFVDKFYKSFRISFCLLVFG